MQKQTRGILIGRMRNRYASS